MFTSRSIALNSSGSPATCGRDAGPVPDVELQREDLRAELVLEILQPVGATGGGDDARAVGGEPAGYGGAEAAAGAGDEDDGWLAACHDYLIVVTTGPATARWSARSAWTSDVAADVAVNPTPVSVAPVAVSAVIACMPGPARPVPCGAASVHAADPAALAGNVQTTTSVSPGGP